MQISPHLAIDTIERIINGFFALLPKLAIAIILFLIFFVAHDIAFYNPNA